MATLLGGTKSQNGWSRRLVKEMLAVSKALSELKWIKAIKSHLNQIAYLGCSRDSAFGSTKILLADGNTNTN